MRRENDDMQQRIKELSKKVRLIQTSANTLNHFVIGLRFADSSIIGV